MTNRWILAPLCLLQAACGSSLTTQRFAQTADKEVAGPPAQAAAAAEDAKAAAKQKNSGKGVDVQTIAEKAAESEILQSCELRLYVEQDASEGAYGVPSGMLGVAMAERLAAPPDAKEGAPISVRDGVCIKRVDRPLELPAAPLVVGTDKGFLERFCVDSKRIDAVTIDDVSGFGCQWNGVFHSAKPFSFTLVTDKTHRVGDYVELVRIYRNGDLMAAWNRASDQPLQYRVKLEGNPLRSGFFAASLPPHLAAMDLRIVPRGSDVGDAMFLKVRDDNALFLKKVTEGLKAGLDEALPKDSPARKSLDCLKQRVVHAKSQVLKTIRGEVPVPQLDVNCALPLGLVYGTPLSDAYADSKDVAREELVKLKEKAELELEEARKKLEAKLPDAAKKALEDGAQALLEKTSQKVRDAVAKRLTEGNEPTLVQFLEREREALGLPKVEITELNDLYDSFSKLAKDVDAQIASALRSVDEARALALSLYEEARRVGTDTERQAQIFGAIAASLRDQGEVFEARRDNPPLLPSEQKLRMEYSDHWQSFLLAPWNGVPIRVGSDSEADLTAAVAVPLLDVFGVRVQWGKSRFADARVAIGIGYTSTERVNDDGTKQAKQAALPNISLGLGTFKVGLGMVTVKAGPDVHDRLRFIVGADLLKLITGSNVEAL